MTQELHYTSVPRGLKPGSRGFCTVGLTPHMPGPLIDRLEALSGYQPVFAAHDPSAALNPIMFSHLRLTIGGKALSVLSRIGPAGLDYSGRPNKYAHHVVLEGNERPEAGPAWLLIQPGFMQGASEGDPREIPTGRTPPQGDHPPAIARAWQSLTGDGGWAGVLAEAFLADPRRTVFLVFRPGMDLLPLFVEALALLPASRRWEVDFSTYFNQLPQGVGCAWRGVLEGSEDAKNTLRLPNALVVDLCHGMGPAEGGALVHLARTGERMLEEPSAMTALPGSGRHIPRMPPEPGAPVGVPRAQTGATRPRSTSGNYDLLPELAKLVPGAGPREFSRQGGPRHRGRKRPLVLIALLLVTCLISFIAARHWQKNESGAQTTQTNGPAEPVLPPKGAVPTTPSSQSQEANGFVKPPDPPPLPASPPASKPPTSRDDHIAKEERAKTRGKPANSEGDPAPIENPLFFPLDEPIISTVGGENKQKPLHFEDPAFRVATMELLGKGKDLGVEATDEGNIKKLIVLLTASPQSELADTGRRELATFEAGPENEIRFQWADNTGPANRNREDARRSLRDSVLKVTSGTEIRYCILRSRPPVPENDKEFNALFTKPRPTGEGGTRSSYECLKESLFAGTSRKLRIERCALWRDGQQKDAIGLKRQGPASWDFLFGEKPLLSVRLEEATIVIDLADNQPDNLSARIGDKKASRKKLMEPQSSKTDHKLQIEELDNEIIKLQLLSELYHSFLDATLTWEVEGIKLEISRVDFRRFRILP